MSNLQKYKLLDPRLEMSSTFRKWFVMLGSPDIVCQVYPTSQFGNGNLTFNIPLPNAYKCVVDRSSAIVALPIRITMHGTGGGSGNIFQPLREGLRSYPFDKMVITSNVNMNGNLIAYQNYEQILPMERFNDNRKNNQIVPTMCDPCQNYSDAYNTPWSPFASRFTGYSEMPRRAYPITVMSNSTTDAVLDTVLYWNIFDYPPFSEQTDVVGINITPFVLNYTFVNNLAHIWSRDADHSQNLQTLTVNVGSNSIQGQPRVSMNVLSLPHYMSIPDSISYPYHLVTFFPSTTTGALAPGATQTQQGTQIIQLSTVPSKIYLYVKVATQTVLASTANAILYPDVFASISRVSITFGNKNNLLASMSQWDLFTMTKKNGLSDKWGFSDWAGIGIRDLSIGGVSDHAMMGSVVCIDPSKDLSLEDGYIVGKNDKINFQALIDYTTISPYTIQYDVCVLCVYDGIQTMRGNQCELNNIVIGDINEIQESPISYHEMKSVYGGAIAGDARSFFSNLWGKMREVAGPINQILKDTKAISKLTPLIPYVGAPISQVARTLGYGEGGEGGEGGDFYEPGGGFIAGEGEGILAGGKVMRRTALKRNLTRYRR